MNDKQTPLTWETLDWTALDRLRDQFLSGTPTTASYWNSASDVANYDFTYAQRIGWKWDAVLRELRLRGWSPPAGPVLDWGCGSGIAGRRVIEMFGWEVVTAMRVFDHSALAMEFAKTKAVEEFPGLQVTSAAPAAPGVGTLIVSHVLNELTESGGQALRQAIDLADAVLWVEPGTHADSRALITLREALREQFTVIAPCTHQAGCGLLAAGNERHWCHHFAKPPAGIMADSDWVKFAQRAGIDLRSLPYSFLVLERRGLRPAIPGRLDEGAARVLGVPRVYKGFSKLLSCDATGVRELEMQKRVAPQIHRAFKDGDAPTLWHWKVDGIRITNPEPVLGETP